MPDKSFLVCFLLNIDNLIDSNVFDQLSFGFGLVNRNEEFMSTSTDPDKIEVPDNVTAYSARVDFAFKNIYSNIEYVYKSDDVRVKDCLLYTSDAADE